MAETLSNLSVIAYVVAGVCFAIAVLLWFLFKIPTVIGDLSGRTARKSIAKMRATNEKTGVKTYQSSKTNAQRGKLTETMHTPKPVASPVQQPVAVQSETGVLAENKPDLVASAETALLMNDNGTAPLAGNIPQPAARSGGKKLQMIEEVMLIHTNEVIG